MRFILILFLLSANIVSGAQNNQVNAISSTGCLKCEHLLSKKRSADSRGEETFLFWCDIANKISLINCHCCDADNALFSIYVWLEDHTMTKKDLITRGLVVQKACKGIGR